MNKKVTIFFVSIFMLALLNLNAQGICLNVPEIFQEHSNWCWDASCKSILHYYGVQPSQCEIANFAWGRIDCCSSTSFYWSHICNRGNYLYGSSGDMQDVLNHWGVGSVGVNSHLSWLDVSRELGTFYRPFAMGFHWTSGGGHALTASCYWTTNGVNYMGYMDPWPGEGYTTSTYNYTVSSGVHNWGQTLKTFD